MNKPITVIREETKMQLADIINSAGLPAFVIEHILSEFLTEVRITAQRQYEMDKVRYETFLTKNMTGGDSDNTSLSSDISQPE